MARALFMLGLSASVLTPGANAWLLEFWSGQADCNHRIRNNGGKQAADFARGGPDHESNNCMMTSYDPTGEGIMAMRVTGWTSDCAIALWSQGSGPPPCRAELPYDQSGINSAKPNYVFTLKSSEVVMVTSPNGPGGEPEDYVCIAPLTRYVQSKSGFLGYVAYSCGGNGTLLAEEFKNSYNTRQMESLIQSISASVANATSRPANISTTSFFGNSSTTSTVAGTNKTTATTGQKKTNTGTKTTSTAGIRQFFTSVPKGA